MITIKHTISSTVDIELKNGFYKSGSKLFHIQDDMIIVLNLYPSIKSWNISIERPDSFTLYGNEYLIIKESEFNTERDKILNTAIPQKDYIPILASVKGYELTTESPDQEIRKLVKELNDMPFISIYDIFQDKILDENVLSREKQGKAKAEIGRRIQYFKGRLL